MELTAVELEYYSIYENNDDDSFQFNLRDVFLLPKTTLRPLSTWDVAEVERHIAAKEAARGVPCTTGTAAEATVQPTFSWARLFKPFFVPASLSSTAHRGAATMLPPPPPPTGPSPPSAPSTPPPSLPQPPPYVRFTVDRGVRINHGLLHVENFDIPTPDTTPPRPLSQSEARLAESPSPPSPVAAAAVAVAVAAGPTVAAVSGTPERAEHDDHSAQTTVAAAPTPLQFATPPRALTTPLGPETPAPSAQTPERPADAVMTTPSPHTPPRPEMATAATPNKGTDHAPHAVPAKDVAAASPASVATTVTTTTADTSLEAEAAQLVEVDVAAEAVRLAEEQRRVQDAHETRALLQELQRELLYQLRPLPPGGKTVWGPVLWEAFHVYALAPAPQTMAALTNFAQYIPCPECAAHYQLLLRYFPIPSADDGRVLFAWSVHVHNMVNARLGKPTWTDVAAFRLLLRRSAVLVGREQAEDRQHAQATAAAAADPPSKTMAPRRRVRLSDHTPEPYRPPQTLQQQPVYAPQPYGYQAYPTIGPFGGQAMMSPYPYGGYGAYPSW
jgi:hypothetical protein